MTTHTRPSLSLIVDFPSCRKLGQISRIDSNLSSPFESSCNYSMLKTDASSPPRRVCFSGKNQIHSIDKPSLEEFQERWVSHKDKRRFKKDLMKDTRKMTSILASTDGDSITAADLNACVGIELFLSAGLAIRSKEKRIMHSNAILGEHFRQREMGVQDDVRLAKVSKLSSKWSRERAHGLAVGYWEILDE